MKSPTVASERIEAIDVLRGVALIGILPVNITNFAMPYSYWNPTVFGRDEWGSRFVHAAVHVLVEQKAMALFSMLFGASIVLLCDKLDRQGRRSSLVYFARNGSLLMIGIVHFIFLSIADILIIYAICAFVLYFFRGMGLTLLFCCGIVVFLLPIAVYDHAASSYRDADTDTRSALHRLWQPSEAKIKENLALFRGSYGGQLAARLGRRAGPETCQANVRPDMRIAAVAILFDSFSRALGMMFIGMAFYRWGVLTAEFGNRFYWSVAHIGIGFGAIVATCGLGQHYAHDWEWQYSMTVGRSLNHIATISMAFGYMSGVMLWSKTNSAIGVRLRLAAMGRMALTNYIGQSVLATTIFSGLGFGWYGYLSRLELLGVVAGILWVQLVFSFWWLRRFRFGPLEWLLRTATYRKVVPMRV